MEFDRLVKDAKRMHHIGKPKASPRQAQGKPEGFNPDQFSRVLLRGWIWGFDLLLQKSHMP